MIYCMEQSASSSSSSAETDTFSKEVQLFAVGREETSSIAATKRALMTIPPTSVEAERVFSAAGLYFTKLRTRMSDRTIDRLLD